MTVKPKSFYVQSWVWGYVTRYPHSTKRQILGAQCQYDRGEVETALRELCAAGYVKARPRAGGEESAIGYEAVEPLVYY